MRVVLRLRLPTDLPRRLRLLPAPRVARLTGLAHGDFLACIDLNGLALTGPLVLVVRRLRVIVKLVHVPLVVDRLLATALQSRKLLSARQIWPVLGRARLDSPVLHCLEASLISGVLSLQ